MATLGEIIYNYRAANNLSMEAFSKLSGISKAYISILERNARPGTNKPVAPSIETIKLASDGMNMDFNELFRMLEGNVRLESLDTKPLPSNIMVPAGRQIPILGTICAGNGIHCEENFEGYFLVDRSIKAGVGGSNPLRDTTSKHCNSNELRCFSFTCTTRVIADICRYLPILVLHLMLHQLYAIVYGIFRKF